MIEYLNAIATLLLLFITVVSLVGRERLDLQKIWEGVEPLKNVLEFIGNLPKWLNYYNNLNGNVLLLQDKRDRLQNRWSDVSIRVEYEEEHKMNKSRKKEVDNWLSSVVTKVNEVHTILDRIDRETNHFSQFLHRAWLGSHVERKIQEVDDLYESGVFEQVLSYAREPTKLVVTPLVGNAAKNNVEKILTWLENGVTKIGVHGIEGIGKTALIMHIHNELLKFGNLHVYMIKVPVNCTDSDLQGYIARELGWELQEEDEMKRAASLNKALRMKKFVLILDGLSKYFLEEKVGIPLNSISGKMVITSRTPDVCRKMGCQLQKTVEVDRLPIDDAMELFKQKLELDEPQEAPVEVVARKIVEQFNGVPRRIIDSAVHFRGVDDISVWERSLNEMLICDA